ncbi:MAG: serine hydrolase domain-containing protein [Acidobacteriota bacterium]
MRRREFLFLSSLAATHGRRVRGATAQDERMDEISRLIAARMAEHHVPGVAFGVVKDGRVDTRTVGVTSVENPQPITPDTVFPIASISKTVAATAIMRLVDDGRLSVAAPVRQYLPDFRVRDEGATRTVTIAHLLSHTPGWEGQLPTEDRGIQTLAHFTSGLGDLPQLAPPGEVWSYNNAGFGVAGRIIEVVAGKSIHDALNELVFAPLGLTLAFTRTGTAMTHRFAVAHRQDKAGRTEVIRPFELPLNVTAGGAAMSLSGLLPYAQFHLGDGTIAGGKRLLSSALVQQMRAPFVRKRGTDDEMGLGWHLRRVGGVLTAAQGGTGGGHCLHVQLVPERRLAFVILTNHAQGWRLVQDVERATLRLYEGLALAPNQRTGGNRGVSETMAAHATPLATQPALDAYAGKYERPPVTSYELRVDGGHLRSGGASGGATYTFYGPDVAYVSATDGTGGAYVGMPVEFIRTDRGAVGWFRVNGRIAKKA